MQNFANPPTPNQCHVGPSLVIWPESNYGTNIHITTNLWHSKTVRHCTPENTTLPICPVWPSTATDLSRQQTKG